MVMGLAFNEVNPLSAVRCLSLKGRERAWDW